MHSIYLQCSGYSIYRIDSVDSSPTNQILVASIPVLSDGGISINNNLDSVAGPETMYFVSYPGTYYFWNGTGWTNTGHSSGSYHALNPGGTSDYIFNLNASYDSLYRYDGAGNGTFLLANLNTNFASVYDVATDNQGNFYLFFTTLQKIIAYNPSGIPIDTFATSGFPLFGGGGLTILGNRIYATTTHDLYEGIKTGNNITFTLIKNLVQQINDIASCIEAATPLAVFKNPSAPHFAIYPNPAHSVVMIKMINTAALEIIDCLGIVRKRFDTRGLTECEVDVKDLEPGAYIINAMAKNKTGVRSTFIVQ